MDTILTVNNLTKTYPAKPPVEAVKGVSFSVTAGSVVALLGPNGAGKTTTIKCILNLVKPTSGKVEVYGREHNDLTYLYRHAAAVLEGNRNLFWRLSPRHNLEVFATYGGTSPKRTKSLIERWLEFFGLSGIKEEVRHLSRGNQQKVAIAAALVRDTPLIILDEPTLGLDVEAKRALVPAIRRLAEEEGKTILLTSHQMDVVEALADRIIIIQNGKVAAEGTPTSLKRLFDSQTYRIEIKLPNGSLPAEIRERWEIQILPGEDGNTALKTVLQDPRLIYRLLEDLEKTGAVLVSLQPDLPDLEEAYVRLVRDGDPKQA